MTWKECQEQNTQYTELLEEFFDSYERDIVYDIPIISCLGLYNTINPYKQLSILATFYENMSKVQY